MAMDPRAWRRFRKNKGALFGALLVASISLMGLIGPFVAPHDPAQQFRDTLVDTNGLPQGVGSVPGHPRLHDRMRGVGLANRDQGCGLRAAGGGVGERGCRLRAAGSRPRTNAAGERQASHRRGAAHGGRMVGAPPTRCE